MAVILYGTALQCGVKCALNFGCRIPTARVQEADFVASVPRCKTFGR